MGYGKTVWVRVTRAQRCPVCEGDSWCSVSADGTAVWCMKVKSENQFSEKQGYLHKLSEPLPVRDLPKPKPTRRRDWSPEVKAMNEHPKAGAERERLSAELGVSVGSLELLEVGLGFDDQQRFSAWPERDIQWRPIGIKRRFTDGSKYYIPGGTSGLYMAREWYMAAGPIFLPEGGSDTAALLTMGLCAVGRPSNIGGVTRLAGLLSNIGNRPIVVLGENDSKPEKRGQEKTKASCPLRCKGCSLCFPGRYGMLATEERLSKAIKRPVYHRMVSGAKDVRGWLIKNGADRLEFVESLGVPKSWLKMIVFGD